MQQPANKFFAISQSINQQAAVAGHAQHYYESLKTLEDPSLLPQPFSLYTDDQLSDDAPAKGSNGDSALVSLRNNGGDFRLAGACNVVASLMEKCRINQVFQCFDSVDDAVASFH